MMDRKKAADLAYAEGYRLGSASRDAEYERRLHSIEAKIAEYFVERDQLRAQIASLREALEEAMYSNSTATAKQKAADALAFTPEQSLAHAAAVDIRALKDTR